jgi:TolB-like protein
MPLTLSRPAATGGAMVLALLAACAPPPGRITPERRAAVDSAVHSAVAQEAQAGAARSTRAIGVTPFAVAGGNADIAPLAYGLADLLTTDLARSHQVEIVDRLALDATLRELQLAESGRVDPTTAPRVGRVVGASRLIIGSLAQPDPNTLGIETRVADVSTSQVQSALSASAPLVDVLAAE